MNKNECEDLLKNLQKLPKKRQLEIYFMIKGAALLAEKERKEIKNVVKKLVELKT